MAHEEQNDPVAQSTSKFPTTSTDDFKGFPIAKGEETNDAEVFEEVVVEMVRSPKERKSSISRDGKHTTSTLMLTKDRSRTKPHVLIFLSCCAKKEEKHTPIHAQTCSAGVLLTTVTTFQYRVATGANPCISCVIVCADNACVPVLSRRVRPS